MLSGLPHLLNALRGVAAPAFSPPRPRGRARLSIVDPLHGWLAVAPWKSNLVMYDWATIAAYGLGQGNANYKVAAMYLEFENNGGAAVTAPTYDRSGGLSYYNGTLASSPNRDYLRVPLIAATVTSDNPTNFPQGDLVTFYAQSSGSVGVHGKTFSDTVSSRVFGAALVATPLFSDAAQDLVFSRIYWPSTSQQIKLPSSQIGVTWPISFQ